MVKILFTTDVIEPDNISYLDLRIPLFLYKPWQEKKGRLRVVLVKLR